MDFDKYKLTPNQDFKLSKTPTRLEHNKLKRQTQKNRLNNDIEEISQLQNKLFAQDRKSLLIIFQGMDSAGKDSAIKHIMRGINPQGVNVTSFKHPTSVELEHDYLWRHAQKMPEHGQIAIFNCSHYENVLISKVHPEIVLSERLPGINKMKDVNSRFWEMRYKQINDFEKRNIENGTYIIKIFLHLSKKEQCKRFLDRIEHKEKHWKFSSTDITERNYWEKYQIAYEQAIKKTNTKIAPWYIVPADNKLYAHLLISKIIVKTLKALNPSFPLISKSEMELIKREKKKLLDELQKIYSTNN
jgi:PPK2 family polyphosphate:nucleotide phosphotransferase